MGANELMAYLARNRSIAGVALVLAIGFLPATLGSAGEPATCDAQGSTAQATLTADADAAARGYQLLRSKPYLPAEFPASAFDSIWRAWPAALQSAAKKATPEERRKMALSRYGLIHA